jgi:GNAT superfamily N-acetyltransferase
MIREWTRGEYTISIDRRLDIDVIHGFLVRSYWAQDRTRERVVQSIEHSLPFGLYHHEKQVGFARVLTDYVVLAFLADVFVLEAPRGKGLGSWMVEVITTLQAAGYDAISRHARRARTISPGVGEPKPGVLMERVDRKATGCREVKLTGLVKGIVVDTGLNRHHLSGLPTNAD